MTVTLVKEDGSGIAGANTYALISDCDTFANNTGNSSWLNLDPVDQKAQFLIQAQYYMAQAFRMRWQGIRHLASAGTPGVVATQVLDWPRAWVVQPDAPSGYGPIPYYYPPTIIPQQIIDAQCMLAFKCVNGPLAPDISRVTLSEQVGTIRVTYDPSRPMVTIYRDVELLLAPFFKTSGVNAIVGRM